MRWLVRHRPTQGFFAGGLIGWLGGLIGLGGAEFRLPVLKGLFKLPTLEAIIFNKAMSLVVVSTALLARSASIPWHDLFAQWPIAVNLLFGSLIGAWFAAGYAMKMPAALLDRIVFILLLLLALVMIGEHVLHLHWIGGALVPDGPLRWVIGLIAGLVIGTVAAVLGVAGGELLIPTITILYGVDIKLAGSLSLAISLPTMLVGFARYTQSGSFAVLKRESHLFGGMTAGSLLGAVLGGLTIGFIAPSWLIILLAVVLLISAYKTFQHSQAGAK
ncbi:TSUP family transporter [Halothiobacillus sp. DCM-1]|uniref:TSUP family transporter n=1 Tax=Halothiobacillus sp. DCM-1 TaxID=3112558 RepID=UPI00324D4401